MVGEDPGRRRRPRPGDVDHVLDGDRDPVQRSARRGGGLGERLLGPHGDVGVHAAVDPLDAVEVELDRLPRRELAGSQPRGEACDAQAGYEAQAGGVSGGMRRSRSASAGRITFRKPRTASKSASSGNTPSRAATARRMSIDGAVKLDSDGMPIYEYRCEQCQERYEEYLSTSDKSAPPCPKGGAAEVTRLFSGISTEWLPSDVAWDRVGRSWE